MQTAPGSSKPPEGNHPPRQRCSRVIAIRICRPLALAVLLTAGLRLHAGEHPVPLDPKSDTAKCLECHEDKGKGAHVHSAVALGCTSCHELRVTKNATRVKL